MKPTRRILTWTIGFALLCGALAVASKNMVVDLDLFHGMAVYRQFEQDGQMPIEDDFAYTPTIDRVIHHEWATGAVLYFVTIRTGWGNTGLVAVKYLLTFAVCIGCFLYARWRGSGPGTFALLTPLALNLGGWIAFTNVRAQLFTLAFLVALFFLLELDRRGKRWWIWIWLPMFVAWANMHGGVVSGIGVLVLYTMAQWIDALRETSSFTHSIGKIKHLIAVGLATGLLLNVNPYGWDYTPYLIRAVRMERPLIAEWGSLWQSGLLASQVTMLVSIVIAGYAILNGAIFHRQVSNHPAPLARSGSPTFSGTFELLVLGLTAYLAIKHLRHGSLYAVAWICLVPPLLQKTAVGETIRELCNQRSAQIAVASIAIGLGCCGFAIRNQFWELRIPNEASVAEPGIPTYPVGAVEYLRQHEFRGNVFVPFVSGAFVSWNLYPDVKVSVDSRYEVAYPPGAVEENVAFYRAKEDWRATLQKYDTQAVLVPLDEAIFAALEKSIASEPDFGWTCVYKDGGYALYFSEQSGHPVPSPPVPQTGHSNPNGREIHR